jgi:hypothetical protein
MKFFAKILAASSRCFYYKTFTDKLSMVEEIIFSNNKHNNKDFSFIKQIQNVYNSNKYTFFIFRFFISISMKN